MILIGTGYNQKGEGIAIHNSKVFYIKNLIIGEKVEVKIIEEHDKWGKAEIVKWIEQSHNRVSGLPKNHNEIGGYEIIHMNREEQTKFKMNKIVQDFKTNAKTDIHLDDIFIGEKQFRYRNKITLHNGSFHKIGTNTPIQLNDFLLTDIKPFTSKKGEVIIRKLDTTISGIKGDNIYTIDKMFGIKFRVSLGAFYQVNKEVAVAAYEKIMSFLSDDKIVFDLYSGIGAITLIAAKKSKHVIGVEWSKVSHKDAISNMKANNITNVEFVNQDVKKFITNIKIKPDVIIVDPARGGLKKDICEAILKLKPQRIIYLSCNPATQASDYNRLKKEYEIHYAKPFDMFPQTYHIENLLILDKKS